MNSLPKPQKRVIVTPRGTNVGQAIINELTAIGVYAFVAIVSITPVRNVQNKTIETTVEYKYN